MPGLHGDVLKIAIRADLPLVLGRPVPWLSGRGHLNPLVQEGAPAAIRIALAKMHADLGGDADLLAAKRSVNPPTPDLVHQVLGGLIEVDEVQHFTTARLRSFEFYPPDVALGFDVDEYRRLIMKWRVKGDSAFAHKLASDFPNRGGRQAQRAYNDALRDLLAPTFTELPVIRVPLPDRSPSAGAATLAGAVRRYWSPGVD